ncbi:MFS transporter [Micromonospora sp. CPCC 206061]|uniref:MFS transporter n=1 Tax=Micromonospora sp. CPCC 206061 TaxID=3122410 RepID=UPI002FEF2855
MRAETVRAAPAKDVSPAAPTASQSARWRYLTLAIVLSATFMQLLDVSIVSIAIPPIQADLRASYSEIELLVGGYLLTFACALLVGGRLGDVYGRKRLFMIGMAGFTATSALCGLAGEPTTLVVARLLQGLFSGLMFPQVLSVIQVVFRPAERHRVYGIYGATLGIATILGPLLGGLLIQADLFNTGWRMIFLINLPIGIAALVLGVWFLPESKARDARRVDLLGATLVTVGLFLLVLPLTVGRDAGWPAWTFLMLATSVAVLAVFVGHQRQRSRCRCADRHEVPLIPWSMLRRRAVSVGLLLNLVFFLGVAPFFFYFIIYLQTGAGFSALEAGLATLPIALAAAVASAVSEPLARRLGRSGLAAGCVLMTLGMGLIILTLHLEGGRPQIWSFVGDLIIAGFGLGLFVSLTTSVVLTGIRNDEAGAASGALATMQQAGGAIGIAVVGVLFFGLIGANANHASAAQTATLRAALTAATLPVQAADEIVEGFRACFLDRANQKDLSATPESCRLAQQRADKQMAHASPDVKAAVGRAMETASRNALAKDFTRSTAQTTLYEVAVFAAAFLLVLALPRTDPTRIETLPPGGV